MVGLSKVCAYFNTFPHTYFTKLPLELLLLIYLYADLSQCYVPSCCCGDSYFRLLKKYQQERYFSGKNDYLYYNPTPTPPTPPTPPRPPSR